MPGVGGFAIGGKVLWDALKAFLNGDRDRDAAAQEIARNYTRFIEVYESAS